MSEHSQTLPVATSMTTEETTGVAGDYQPYQIDIMGTYNRMSEEERQAAQAGVVKLIRKTVEDEISEAIASPIYQRSKHNRSYHGVAMYLGLQKAREKEPAMRAELEEFIGEELTYYNSMPLALKEGVRAPRQFKYWLKGMKLRTSPYNRSFKERGLFFWDANRRYQIRPEGDDLVIDASIVKNRFMDFSSCTAATVPMGYTEKDFRKAIQEVRARAKEVEVGILIRRSGPEDLRAWCLELGMESTDGSYHYYKWQNRYWRLNCLGRFQVSEMLETFDRWANSVEHTMDNEILWNKEQFLDWCQTIGKTYIP